MNINKIGNLIARQRIAKKMTQDQLAKKTWYFKNYSL